MIDSHFTNIEDNNVMGLKPGYDYAELDEYGLIREDTYLNDKMVLIGKITELTNPEVNSQMVKTGLAKWDYTYALLMLSGLGVISLIFSIFFLAKKPLMSSKCSLTRLLPNSNTLVTKPSKKSRS